MNEKVIIHADLNNFYASVSCVNSPKYIDYPTAVCGDPDLRHGIVLANKKIMVLKQGKLFGKQNKFVLI